MTSATAPRINSTGLDDRRRITLTVPISSPHPKQCNRDRPCFAPWRRLALPPCAELPWSSAGRGARRSIDDARVYPDRRAVGSRERSLPANLLAHAPEWCTSVPWLSRHARRSGLLELALVLLEHPWCTRPREVRVHRLGVPRSDPRAGDHPAQPGATLPGRRENLHTLRCVVLTPSRRSPSPALPHPVRRHRRRRRRLIRRASGLVPGDRRRRGRALQSSETRVPIQLTRRDNGRLGPAGRPVDATAPWRWRRRYTGCCGPSAGSSQSSGPSVTLSAAARRVQARP